MAEAAESNISFSSYFKSFSDTLTSSAFPQLYVMLQDIKKDAQKREKSDKEKRQRDGGTSNKILSDDLREIQTTLEEMNVVLEASRDEHIKTNQLLERLLVDGGKGGGNGGGNTLIKEAEELSVYEVLKKAAVRLLPLILSTVAAGGAVATLAYEDEIKKYAINPALGKLGGLSPEEMQKRQNDYNNSTFMGNLQQDIEGWKNLFTGGKKSSDFELGDKYVDNAIKNEKTKLEGFTKQYEEEQKVVGGLAAEIERQKKDGEDSTENQKLLLKLQVILADDLKLKTESEKTLFELQKAKDNAPVPGVPNIPNITDQGVQKNPDGTIQDSSGRTILQTAKPNSFEDSIKGMEAPTIHNNSIVSGTNKTNHDVSELEKRISGGGSIPSSKELTKNQQISYDTLRKLGYSDQAARVVTANLSGEALGDPSNTHPDGSRSNPNQVAHGIASWDDFRANRIKEHFGKLPNELSVEDQVKAYDWERKTFPKEFAKMNSALDDPNATPEEQMWNTVRYGERPANPMPDTVKRMQIMRGMKINGNSSKENEIDAAKNLTPIEGETHEELLQRVKEIAPSLTTGECVDLAFKVAGIHGSVKDTRRGRSIYDGLTPRGTPIGTFLNRDGTPSDKYDGGVGVGIHARDVMAQYGLKAGTTHMAIMDSYIRDKDGKIIGHRQLEQSKGISPHIATYMRGDPHGGEKDSMNYNEVNDMQGLPAGDYNPARTRDLQAKADKIVGDTKQFTDDRMISKSEDQEQLYKTVWADNMKYGDGHVGINSNTSDDLSTGKDRRQWHIGTLPDQDEIAHNLLRNALNNNNQLGDLSGSMENIHGNVDSNLSTQLLKESFDNSVEDHGRHKENNQVQKQFTDDKSVQDHGFHKDKTDKTDAGVVSPPDHVLQKLFTTPPS